MGDLRAGQVTAHERIVVLRCPERGCGRILVTARAAEDLETVCPRCKTKAVWQVRKGSAPLYRVIERRERFT